MASFLLAVAAFVLLGGLGYWGGGGQKVSPYQTTINQKSAKEIAPTPAASTVLAAKYLAHNNQQHIHLGNNIIISNEYYIKFYQLGCPCKDGKSYPSARILQKVSIEND